MATIDVLTNKTFVRPVVNFFQRSDIQANLDLLGGRLPSSAQIFIAGGAIRNLVIDILHGNPPPTRDIDIFIGGLPEDYVLSGLLSDQQAELTDLRGVRWYPHSSQLVFDLSRLSDFLVIRRDHLAPTLENLLAGIDFSMNAIVYDPFHARLMERGCITAVYQRLIDFNSLLIPDKRLIAYRIMLMGHKTGFIYSRKVFRYMRTQLELDALTQVKNLFTSKYGKSMAASILNTYTALCRWDSYEDYLAANRSNHND